MTQSLSPSTFSQWLEGYKAAWEERDPSRAAALFTDDASYRETPFDEPMKGRAAIRDYWTKAVAGQKEVRFTYEVLGCTGDVGICHWHAAFAGVPGGETIDLDGLFRCRFEEEGQVADFEEWWHIKVTPPTSG